jgi:hypothetical protein
MDVTVEILRWADGANPDSENPEVLQSVSHNCHSLGAVIATAQKVVESPEVPGNGYRIITDKGVEMYGWPDAHISSAKADQE